MKWIVFAGLRGRQQLREKEFRKGLQQRRIQSKTAKAQLEKADCAD